MNPKKQLIPYNPDLIQIAGEYRNNPTPAEKLLWTKLKGKQRGYDFHRQKPLDNYIVDFYCNALRLAIEVDGEVHNTSEQRIKDEVRSDILEDYGIRILRFSNEQVFENSEDVVAKIDELIGELESKVKD